MGCMEFTKVPLLVVLYSLLQKLHDRPRPFAHLNSKACPQSSPEAVMSNKFMDSARRNVKTLHISSCTVITWSDVACSLSSRQEKMSQRTYSLS